MVLLGEPDLAWSGSKVVAVSEPSFPKREQDRSLGHRCQCPAAGGGRERGVPAGSADELCDIGDLVSSLRELGWEDVAEFVIRRKLSPADRLFRKLREFVADELAAQHSTAVRPGVPSVPGGPSLLGRGL